MYEKDELEDVELEEEETSEEDIESVQETKKAKSKKETITLDFSMNAIERLQIEIDFTDSEYQKVVGRYLLKEFEKDEELRLAYFTKKITLEQVWKHIYEYAKAQTKKPGNSNCVCLSDEEVFGQAVHFIQDGAPIKEYKDNKVTLSKEVKKSLEEQAKEEYLAEQKRKLEEAEKKHKEVNEGLKKAYSILKSFIENTGEFQLVLPKSQHDLVQWGNKLHMCVGTMGYGEKMSKGNTIILGIFLQGQIVECCQIGLSEYDREDKEMKVLQLRGDHNTDSPYHNECKALTNQFLMNYKPQNLMGAVI